jgi:hypothetical protein
MDDIFNSAYRQYEDDPSTGVWDKINAGLDKKDAVSYKRRFIGWKRIAIVAMLLLSGFILYEFGILKTGSRYQKENIPVADENKKTETSAAENNEEINQHNSKSAKSNNEKTNEINNKISDENDSNTGMIVNQDKNILTVVPDKMDEQKVNILHRKVKAIAENDQLEIEVTPSAPGKYQKDVLKNNEILLKEKTFIPLIEKNTEGENKVAANLFNGARQIHLLLIADSIAKSNVAKNKNKKWTGKFKPYWTVTGFASREWANYKLENDLQSINKIKQQEVHEPSYSAGAFVTRQFSPQWALQTGLVYSKTSIGINPQEIYAFNDQTGSIAYKYISSSGYGYVTPGFGSPPSVGDSLTAKDTKHTLQHISVPLVIKYRIGKNRFSFLPGAGVAANFQTSAKIITEVGDGSHKEIVSINKLNGTRSFYLSFTADAELQYKISNRASVSFRPAFRYAISPITKNNVVETYPYSFGAGLGLTYRL